MSIAPAAPPPAAPTRHDSPAGPVGFHTPAAHPSAYDAPAALADYGEFINAKYAKVTITADYGVFEDRADGCYVFDNQGRRYLDCLASYGVMNLGHRHPKVVEAVKAQLDRMPLTTKELLNPLAARLGRMMAERLPGGLKYTFLCNSGAEASEGALKLARWHTGKPGIVSTHGSFHGKTLGALATTSRAIFREPLEPLLPGVRFIDYGDLDALRAQFESDPTIGTLILEPVQGEGGVNVPPPGYLAAACKLAREFGVVSILDECQTGMGRTGSLFAAIREGAEPDLLTGGKAFGGGVIPAGFVTGTAELWTKLNDFPTFHTSTFGGGQLACAAAIAAIEATEELDLCNAAVERGRQFQDGFRALMAEFPTMLKDVRGIGLLIAVEFQDGDVAGKIYNRLFEEGILVGFLLRNPTVMRMEPPLIMTAAEVDFALGVFRRLFAEATA